MAINYYQNGKLKTVVNVKRVKMKLGNTGGHWSVTPVGTVSKGDKEADIFQTINSDSNICGPEGWVDYQSLDGSVFYLHFDCPTVHNNVCDATVSENSPYVITGTVPAHGADIDYKWTITQAQFDRIIDVPVSAVDLLNTSRCDLVPVSKILKYIDGREYVSLKDVFACEKLHPEAKLWCAKHALFLTSQGKAELTRRLVEKAIKEADSDETKYLKGLIDRAMEFHIDLSKGNYCRDKNLELQNALQQETLKPGAVKGTNRSGSVVCILDALRDSDLEAGWRTAVDTYVNYYEKEGVEKRRNDVIQMIEDAL